MRPRLVGIEIVRDAQMLSPDQVQQGDWRLQHLNEAACREMAADRTDTDHLLVFSFVTWPDLSLGFVALPADDALPDDSLRRVLIEAAYRQARDYFEWMNLRLFDLAGAGIDTPQ